jgi:hypothetical protein
MKSGRHHGGMHGTFVPNAAPAGLPRLLKHHLQLAGLGSRRFTKTFREVSG